MEQVARTDHPRVGAGADLSGKATPPRGRAGLPGVGPPVPAQGSARLRGGRLRRPLRLRRGRARQLQNTSSSVGRRSPRSRTSIPPGGVPSRASSIISRPSWGAGSVSRRATRRVRARRSRCDSARTCRVALCGAGELDLEDLAADPVLELVPRTLRDHATVVDHGDPVGELVRLLEVLGREQGVVPSRPSSRTTDQISLRLRGSRPVVGSSRNSTRGRVSRLDARSSRRRIPPDMSCAALSAASARSKRSSSSAARSAGCHGREIRTGARTSEGSPGRSASRRPPRIGPSGRAAPHVRRLAATSCRGTSALPASGRSKVERMRTRVVLPAPFGPRRPITVPSETSRSTPASACVVPKRFVTPSTRTAGGVTSRSCVFVLRREEIAHREAPVRAPGCASITPPSTGSALRRSSRAFRSASGARWARSLEQRSYRAPSLAGARRPRQLGRGADRVSAGLAVRSHPANGPAIVRVELDAAGRRPSVGGRVHGMISPMVARLEERRRPCSRGAGGSAVILEYGTTNAPTQASLPGDPAGRRAPVGSASLSATSR